MSLTTDSVHKPGQLGTPGMQLKDDPRADPRMVAAMAVLGMDVAPEPAPVTMESPIEDVLEYCGPAEEGFAGLGMVLTAETPPVEGVIRTTEVIRGLDDNDINLYIHRPADVTGPLPCIVHTHGGGMVILKAADAGYVRWRDELALTGLLVVGVEFRNGAGELGPHTFPAGLNDCTSAAQWVHENREQLGISKIVLSGESGGGNLALATSLKAKQQGWLSIIDGVYAQCPYISGMYHDKTPDLPSLYENDDYFLNCAMLGALVKAYDHKLENMTNPLAWPYHAEVSDLEGMPPHVISVNELDPLRDEGLAYFRKLGRAGVSAISRTVNGTVHAGDCLFLDAMPDVYRATIRDINSFANAL